MFIQNLAHLVAGLVASSRQFRTAWKSAASMPSDLVGRWQGEWLSDVNGHRGKLKCVIPTVDGDRYKAIFHAVYWKLLRVSYSVWLTAERTGETFAFRGEIDLGRLAGGVYRFDGTSTLHSFAATYDNQYDHGTFRMTRVI